MKKEAHGELLTMTVAQVAARLGVGRSTEYQAASGSDSYDSDRTQVARACAALERLIGSYPPEAKRITTLAAGRGGPQAFGQERRCHKSPQAYAR